MDFKQIEAFVNVVRYKSFSKAADATFFTQPTISTHIRNLEKETEEMNNEKPETYPVFGNIHAKSGNLKGRMIPNEPEDITGGYILEYDHDLHQYADEPSVFVTNRTMMMIVHSPEYCSEQQIKYISALMKGFENAIFSKDI